MATEQQTPAEVKSGVIVVIGRPSAGKSSLVNRICGAKVAITSPYPQTTRTSIRGIYTEQRGQLLFLDTPGYHLSDKKLNRGYQDVVRQALPECDALLYVRDVTRYTGSEEQAILRMAAESGRPWAAVLNKLDVVTGESAITGRNPLQAGSVPGERWPEFGLTPPAGSSPPEDGFSQPENGSQQTAASLPLPAQESRLPPAAVTAVSATSGAGIGALLDALFLISPVGEPMYPAEYYTDQDPQFRIAEVIREQAIQRTTQEVPHAMYVEIADAEYDSTSETLKVRAFLIVERDSQKGIVVGKGGEKIKAIRMGSLRQLKQLFDYRIRLDLRVKVQPKWRQREGTIRRITRAGFSH